MKSGKQLISTLSQLNNNHTPTKPLFTLHHSSTNYASSHPRASNNQGYGVSSICFIRRRRNKASSYYEAPNVEEFKEDSSDFETDESESELEEEDCYLSSSSYSSSMNQVGHWNSLLSPRPISSISGSSSQQEKPTIHRPLHASTLDIHASLSLENIQLASTHVNGCAYIWDLTKRRVVQTLQDDGTVGVGPGLSIGLLPSVGSCYSPNTTSNTTTATTRSLLFHQKRDDMGTISIYDQEYNVPVQKIQCLSKTFCHAKASSHHEHLLLTPSKHGSFAQLWDLRMKPGDGNRSPLGLIHGAKLEQCHGTRWNEEGMLTSLGFCDDRDGEWYVIGCGMESGKVYFHDLRMMGKASKSGDVVGENPSFDILDHKIVTDMCSVALGKDPVLCLDMFPSLNEYEDCSRRTKNSGSNMDVKHATSQNVDKQRQQRSVIAIAGVAADAAEQLTLDEQDRGTVAVLKATTSSSSFTENMISLEGNGTEDAVKKRMKARMRAKVGTCQVTDELSREAKPGVGICKFRPDGKIFAVGGWDKRIRLYSRTSAKMLTVLRGSNEGSISALDWIPYGNGGDGCILAAGSNDGKISIWRPPRF